MSGPDFDESGRIEVPVKRECFTDAPATHRYEAGRVHKRVLALWATAEPTPSVCLGGFIDVNDLDIGKRGQSVKKSHCSRVSRAAPDQRPSFSDHMISGENSADAAFYERPSILMASITTFLKAKPETGVSEPHRFRS